MKWKALQMPERIVADDVTTNVRIGRFVVEPLERGFGTTLGNALRRVMLSSLQGAAVVALKVEDERVQHEFTSIPGVLEDVTDIVLNLKQIRFKHHGDGPRRGRFSANGKVPLKAGDLEISSDIEVLNPDQHIATVNTDGELTIFVEVAAGKGYVSAEDQPGAAERPIGWISLDALFSPVVAVNFEVENTRIGQRIDFDKLTVTLETDGSILPSDALAMSAKILRDHFSLFIKFEESFEEEREEIVDEEYLRIKELLEKGVDELELSVRSSNCLRAAKIRSLGDLVTKTEAEMLQYRNFGKKSLKEISDLLVGYGLSFGMDVSRYLGPQATTPPPSEIDDLPFEDEDDEDFGNE